MPSHKPVKTYQKKTRPQTKSVEAVNALFAQNLTQRLKARKKTKLKVKELPPRTGNYMSDDSLKVDPNGTFDKLLKGEVYNPVKICKFVKINSSTETSKSTSFRTPILTRKRKNTSVKLTEVADKSTETSSLDYGKSSTRVTSGCLSIEKEKEHKQLCVSSLSYIKLDRIPENEISKASYQPIFSETFRERQMVHSSTPFLAPTSKIVQDLISPITKSDSSKLIEKSYDQIRQWDENFPKEDTPLRRSLRRKNDPKGGRRRHFSNEETDWKLTCLPKVYLQRPSVAAQVLDFKGFTEAELSSSREESKSCSDLLKSLEGSKKKNKNVSPSVNKSSSAEEKIENNSQSVQRSTIWKNTRSKASSQIKAEKVKASRPSKQTEMKPVLKKSSINTLKGTVGSETKRRSRSYGSSNHRKTRAQRASSSGGSKGKRRSRLRSSGSNNHRLMGAQVLDLKGFSEAEQSSSWEESKIFSDFLKSLEGSKKKNKKVSPSVNKSSSAEEKIENNSQRAQRSGIWKNTRSKASSQIKAEKVKASRSTKQTKMKPVSKRSPRKTSNFITNTRKIRSMTSTMKKSSIDVTDHILSEKEMSYSSFDSKQADEETSSLVLTVDFKDFDNFEQNFWSVNEKTESKDASIISVSDDSVFGATPIKPKELSMKAEPNTNSFFATPSQSINLHSYASPAKSSHSTSNKTNSKIIVLSDISLPRSPPSWILEDTLNQIYHDHSYTCSPLRHRLQSTPLHPPRPQVQSTPFRTPKPRLQSSSIPRLQNSLHPSPNPRLQNSRSCKSSPMNISDVKPLPVLNIKPGKSYKRSLSLLRRSSIIVDEKACPDDCICLKCIFKRKLNLNVSRKSSQIVPVGRKTLEKSVLQSYAESNLSYVQGEDYIEDLDESVRNLALNATSPIGRTLQLTAKDLVLRRCGQTEVLRFDECYPTSLLQNCQKIGEGVYGEVFLYRNQNGGTTVMKVIPVEGDLIVNGDRQKKFEEILSEIVITMELSNLRNHKKNTTGSFAELQRVRCTQGNYPDRLLDLWDLYDENKGSENDSPQMFPSDQLYIVLELANGGIDLESFVFNNAEQAFAMFKQTAFALAVAENELQFEHRDLHWGNVLISPVDKNKTLTYRINGIEVEVKTLGVEVTIIDFTLSRIEFDGVVIFNDLSLDNELFAAKGDYQFEIYRLMQKANENEWQHFNPYSNVLWLHYILDKVTELRFKNIKSKSHKEWAAKLKRMKKEILKYDSVTALVLEQFF